MKFEGRRDLFLEATDWACLSSEWFRAESLPGEMLKDGESIIELWFFLEGVLKSENSIFLLSSGLESGEAG